MPVWTAILLREGILMADNDRWRRGQGRDRAENQYEDWGGRAGRGRFAGGGGARSNSEDYRTGGGSPGGSGREGQYGRANRSGYGFEGSFGGEKRGGSESRFGGDDYGSFYGADQSGRGRSEDRERAYRREDNQGGYLDRPRGAYGHGQYSGRDEERGFWDRATDEVSSWFRGGGRDEDVGRGEHRGRGPKGYARSDERIREDVNDRLTDDPYVDASDIEVSVSNREVTLSGTVDSREAKRRAEDIAESIPGVTHVQNNLRVGQSTGTAGPVEAGASTTGVTTPPMGESITAMNSSDANRIAAKAAGSTAAPGALGSRRK